MSLMLGTVFFALVQNSIDNGFKSGVIISVGVIASDMILITFGYFNAELIPEGGTTEMIVRLAGGIFLIGYGISNIVKKKSIAYPETKSGRTVYFLITGFLLNFLNPGNFIGWLAISTHLKQVALYTPWQCLFFYTGALTAIFFTEMAISFAGSSLKRFISDKLLRTIDKVVGVIFIGFSVYLLIPFVQWLLG